MSRPDGSSSQHSKRSFQEEERYRNVSQRASQSQWSPHQRPSDSSFTTDRDHSSRNESNNREAERRQRRRGGHDGERDADLFDQRRTESHRRMDADESRSRDFPTSHTNGATLPQKMIPSSSGQGIDSTQDDIAEADFDLEDEETEQKRIEEQRRRRRELLEKYKDLDSGATAESVSTTPGAVGLPSGPSIGSSTPLPKSPSAEIQTPHHSETTFDLSKHGSLSSQRLASATASKFNPQEEISAADYDPTLDRKADVEREQRHAQLPLQDRGADLASKQSLADGVGEPKNRMVTDAEGTAQDDSDYEDVEIEDEEDVDDMFAVGDGMPRKKIVRIKKKRTGARDELEAGQTGVSLPSHGGLTDNWDDAEGYYRIILGEKIGPGGRFHVFANLGKGMFSEVVRAKDLGDDGRGNGDKEVAIKIVRSQETMYKAGLKEIGILNKLSSLDPDDKRHIVRLLSHFEHRGHLCMVFESLSMNLRDIVKRFGKDVGLNLRAVRAYAHQMFLSLSLLKKAEVMHADIKPDNILVNEAKTMLKICDLGSASDMSEMEITPYLVSRFYRAPEIILGQPYDCSLDMWSIGCTLYELYTGKILFPGRSNNQMLLLIQELRGKFTTRQIRKGRFSDRHFDESNTFLSYETDKNTGNETIRKVNLSTTSSNDFRSRLLPSSVLKSLSDDEIRFTQQFVDLLNKTLELDPARRITPNEALKHPFLM